MAINLQNYSTRPRLNQAVTIVDVTQISDDEIDKAQASFMQAYNHNLSKTSNEKTIKITFSNKSENLNQNATSLLVLANLPNIPIRPNLIAPQKTCKYYFQRDKCNWLTIFINYAW
ncbi:MAG: hypothetical protein RLZZ210_1249 [Pseudomonadota bacterium]|jgi:hypothetical protein